MTSLYYNPLHRYLAKADGVTAASMYAEVERLRRLGVAFEELPATWAAFFAGIRELESIGGAEVTSKGLVLYVAKRVDEVKSSGQGMMF